MDKYIETVGEVDENFGLKVIETKYYTVVMRFRRLVLLESGDGYWQKPYLYVTLCRFSYTIGADNNIQCTWIIGTNK